MTDQCVPVRRTTFTLKDYSRAAMRAWKSLCGNWPSKAAVGCLWAQYALETGRGAFCWGNNIGNVKYTAGHDYQMLNGTWEIVNGKRVVFTPPHRATWFNAYDSLDDAMMEHLRLLKQGRYASSWPAIEAGLPGEFAVALKQRGYYTAPVEDYARGLRAHHQDFMNSWAFEDATRDLEALLNADTEPELPASIDETPLPRLITPILEPVLHADPSVYLQNEEPQNAASSPTIYPRMLEDDPDDAA